MPGADGKLCKVCIGDSEVEGVRVSSRCAASHDERYYGNMGALRYALCQSETQVHSQNCLILLMVFCEIWVGWLVFFFWVK